jgi:hypothetical protein
MVAARLSIEFASVPRRNQAEDRGGGRRRAAREGRAEGYVVRRRWRPPSSRVRGHLPGGASLQTGCRLHWPMPDVTCSEEQRRGRRRAS